MGGFGPGAKGGGPPPSWLMRAGMSADAGAAPPTTPAVTRIAFLGRTSTEDQQDPTISIPRQVRNCLNALPDGPVIVAYFYDIESGRKDLSERGRGRSHELMAIPVPRDGGIQDLLAEAEGGQARFDAVICESVERIARRTYYGTLIEHRLERAGVPLLASDEPIVLTGRTARSATQVLTRRVKQGVAEWYVLDMLEKSWGGFEEHTRQGFNVGKPPYGYIAVKIPHPVPAKRAEGKHKSRLAPDSLRGPVVEQIFKWRAVERMTHEEITSHLNADLDHYPPPEPPDPSRALGYWTKNAVRDILKNPKYTGHMVWNRRATKSGRGKHNPPSEWIWSAEPTHPALIDVELFVVASEETPYPKRTRGGPGPNKNHPDTQHTYALRTHMICALCEHAMFGKHRHGVAYYCCIPSRHLRPEGHPATLYVHEEALLDGVNRFFLARVFGEERESLLYALTDHQAASAATEQERRARDLEAAIQDVDKRRSRQVRALELSDDDEGFIREVRCRVAELGVERARLVTSLDALNAERPPTVDPTLIRALPIEQINLATLDHELRFKLFRLFRLEVRYDKLSNRADCTITLTRQALPTLQSEISAAGFLVPPECVVHENRKGTDRNYSSSAPILTVPPVGFEPTHPPPEGGALSPELRGLGT